MTEEAHPKLVTEMSTIEKLEWINQTIGGQLGVAFHDAAVGTNYPRPIGFALLTFDLGAGGHMVWISSAERDDMIEALREMLRKFETGEADGLASEDGS